jgi:hypothetical protein
MPKEDELQQVIRGKGEDGLLRGKVAKLLNVRLLVINIGSKQGVREGMEFAVLNRNTGEIRDPDTQVVLGSVVLPKVRVIVTTIFEELSVAEVKGGYRRGGNLVFAPWLYTPESGTLRTQSNPEIEEIDEKDSIVKVGDVVMEIRPPKMTRSPVGNT